MLLDGAFLKGENLAGSTVKHTHTHNSMGKHYCCRYCRYWTEEKTDDKDRTDCECVGLFLCVFVLVCERERTREGARGRKEEEWGRNTQEEQIGVKSLRSIAVDRPLYGCLIV